MGRRTSSYKKTDVEAVEQNLRDAGCPDEFIVTFMRAWDTGTAEEQLRLLACQRCRLLDSVHAEQKKLDCLDYLRYQLQKAQKSQMRAGL